MSDARQTMRVAAALRRAGLPSPARVAPLTGGFANVTCLATLPGDRRLVVTLNRGVSRERALATFALHRALYDRGEVPVAEPLAAVDGDAELVLIKEYVPGVVGQILGSAQITPLCRALRALHETPIALAPPELEGLSYGPRAWSQCREWGPDHAEVAGWLGRWRLRLEAAGFAALPRAIVHGDIDGDNTVWDAADPAQLRAVIDWEEAAVCPRLWDVAGVVAWSHWRLPEWRPALREAAERGYGGLTDDERGVFRLFAGANIAANAFWFYRKHLQSGGLGRALGRYREMRSKAEALAGFA